MKKDKIDSEILDDNFFPPKEKHPSTIKSEVITLFKIIGFTILFSSLFIAIFLFILSFLAPNLYQTGHFATNTELIITIVFSYFPFLCFLYVLQQDENFYWENWKIAVLVISFSMTLIISLFMLLLFNNVG